MTDNDGQPTTPKNSSSNSPQNEAKASDFPPKGLMSGHIFIRSKYDPTRFKIRASDGTFYDYEGTPAEGDHLRRLAPVVFRSSPHSTRAEEVTEIIDPKQAARVTPLEGILIEISQDRGYGLISVVRMDGSYDRTPFKFYTSKLENQNGKLPKAGSHVLFRTHFAQGTHKDKGGCSVESQRYIN